MASELKVDKISPTGTAFTFGDSGDSFNFPSGATVTANAGTTVSGFGGGKVGQCLQTVKTDTATSSSTSFSTIISVTITPSATSSKVLVMYHFQGYGGNAGASIKIIRDSTDIYIGDADGSRIRGAGNFKFANSEDIENLSGHYLDSPSSTSAIVYALQWRSNGATNYLNRASADANSTDATRVPSSITVMEILA